MDKNGLILGIIGGFGLGLLIGSEISGRVITLFGSLFVIIFLLGLGF
jgi:hypothetical protein